jgi:hypothetical protein
LSNPVLGIPHCIGVANGTYAIERGTVPLSDGRVGHATVRALAAIEQPIRAEQPVG